MFVCAFFAEGQNVILHNAEIAKVMLKDSSFIYIQYSSFLPSFLPSIHPSFQFQVNQRPTIKTSDRKVRLWQITHVTGHCGLQEINNLTACTWTQLVLATMQLQVLKSTSLKEKHLCFQFLVTQRPAKNKSDNKSEHGKTVITGQTG